jgi:hypothetical protein
LQWFTTSGVVNHDGLVPAPASDARHGVPATLGRHMRRLLLALFVFALASLGVQATRGAASAPVDLSPAAEAAPAQGIGLDTVAVLVASTSRPPLAPWRSGGFDPTLLAVVLGVVVAAGATATGSARRRTVPMGPSPWVAAPRRGPPLLPV